LTRGQGGGGVGLAARCRAGVCGEWGWARRRCTGMARALWALWASRLSRNGVASVGCTVGLEVLCLGELILRVEANLMAR
jgi:hypothetical protein